MTSQRRGFHEAVGHRRIGKGRAPFQRLDDRLLSGNPRFKLHDVLLGLR
jgi:hypothetical protein